MAKHEDTSKTAATKDHYIGRHRDRTEIRPQGSGWSVGRGVQDRQEFNRTPPTE